MKIVGIFWGVVLIMAFLFPGTTHADNASADAPPTLAPTEWPTPPAQALPWDPPQTTLPPPVIAAAQILFFQGLADPRNCEYREIEVWVGRKVATHGWVLPAPDQSRQQFAVCWDGLLYPAVTVGEKVDLTADVISVLDGTAAKVSITEDSLADYIPWRVPGAQWQEKSTLRSLLLLRLGAGDMAAKMWVTSPLWRSPRKEDEDPYLALADSWLTVMWYRLVSNHASADDPAALHWARELTRLKPLVEAEADKRGNPEPEFRRAGSPLEDPLWWELRQARAVAADQERRLREGRNWHPPALPDPAAAALRFSPARRALDEEMARRTVLALITELENVRADVTSIPGPIEWDEDAIFRALLAKGEQAVPALLECWENDPRLTRTLWYGRPWGRKYKVIPVQEVAEVIVSGILKTRFKDLAEAKAYWAHNQGVAQEDRWYATLSADAAGTKQWMQAARNIVQPVDVVAGVGGWVGVPNRRPDDVPGLRGENLRQRNDPSVLALLTKRAADISSQGQPGSEQMFAIRDGCSMALCAARWDLQGSRELLAAQMKRCISYIEADRANQHTSVDQHLGTMVGKLAHARLHAGDQVAAEEFVGYLKGFDPASVSFNHHDYLMLMWRYPHDATLQAAAHDLFLKDGSSWNPILQKAGRAQWARDFLRSPMLGVDAFRAQLLQQLVDESPVGHVTVQAGGSLERDQQDEWKGQYLLIDKADPLAPQPGEYPVRVCDVYVTALSSTPGLPWVEWYWPQEKRDAARHLMIQRLKQYGPRFAFVSILIPGEPPDDIQGRMVFPKADHPATTAEVEQGLAIFSLEGQGERRLAPMETFPAPAKWTTPNDHPWNQSFWDPQTKLGGTRVAVDQAGLIWQAEEVLQEGKWVRYYGFVGRHVLAKVPAEETTFPRKGE